MDLLRSGILITMCFSYSETAKRFMLSSDILAQVFKYVNVASFVIMLVYSLKQFTMPNQKILVNGNVDSKKGN